MLLRVFSESFEKNFQDTKIPNLKFLDLITFESSKHFSKKKKWAFEISKSRLSQYLRYFGLKKAQKSILERSGSLKVKRISFVIINVVGGACGELVSRGTSRAGRSRRSSLILKRLRRCYPRLSRRRHPPSKQPEFRWATRALRIPARTCRRADSSTTSSPPEKLYQL